MQSKRVLPPQGRGGHPSPVSSGNPIPNSSLFRCLSPLRPPAATHLPVKPDRLLCTPKMAPLSPVSPLLSPTAREAGVVGEQCTLRRPRLAGNAASAPSSPVPPSSSEDIPSDVPLIADLIKTCAVPFPGLVFRGWRKPVKEWKTWVESMAREEKFVRAWRAAGIEDAILNSMVNIRYATQMMLALVGLWCPSTCTFVLPWGEIGFTLEDAHMLGNLPVWGSPLQRLLTVEEERLRLRLMEVWDTLVKMMKKSGKRARISHSFWLNWFLKLEGDDELLHLGFLAYWLSKFVVPCKPLHEVPSAVFGIAARLCRGERVALAPAVTANLYSDLTIITKLLYEFQGGSAGSKIEVWAQFRLLQVWLWERFACLSPKNQNPINQQLRVRIARWDSKQNHLTYSETLETFCDPKSFSWRPYINELENWVKPKWYSREEQSIVVNEHSPIWVYDILAIVSAAGLVGLVRDDIVPMGQYKPDRVSMQLGYDQAIPASTGPLVVPWDSSTICPIGIEFYIPSITRKCSTLNGYHEWWENYTMSYAMALNAWGRGLKEKIWSKRTMNDADNEDNSKKLSMDGNIKKAGLSGEVKGEYERAHQEQEPDFAEKPTNSIRHPIIEVLDDEAPDVIIVEDEQGEEIKQNDPEHSPQSYESSNYKLDFDDVLVDELEEFLAHGLVAELLSSVSSPSSRCNDRSTAHNYTNASEAAVGGDNIGEEIIRKYPKFFNMIPQYPHYIGLLQSNVDAGTKKIVYTSLWYKLVELMQKAIRTTCQTKASEIEQLKKEARSLEKLGFDVRHLIARLRQPEKRFKKLESAKIALEKARKRLEVAEKQCSLENISTTHVSNLQKAVKEAEINVLEREWEVEILGNV